MSGDINISDAVARLTQIGIALSAEQDMKALLGTILSEARAFTRAEAGSIYLREGDHLEFLITQNENLSKKFGHGETNRYMKNVTLPLTAGSMAAYVTVTGELLNIPDVYEIPGDAPYSFNTDLDKKNEYRSRSMLLVPMRAPDQSIIGVLQLINRRPEGGEPEAFPAELEALCTSLTSQAAVAIRNARLSDELRSAYIDTVFRLSVAAEYRDDDTAAHIKRMCHYSARVARELGLSDDQVKDILCASPMHDIGKIGVPDSILLKPGKLTKEEFEIMKQHTIIGAKILSGSDSRILRLSEVIAMTHHERFNGNGYPAGLKGEKIPLVGRIVAIADVFDALTSERCYKKAFPVEKALDILREERDEHFDPNVVDAFFAVLEDILRIKNMYQEGDIASFTDLEFNF